MRYLPETIIQFGSGRFLRAFADLFIHQANLTGQDVGRVVIVQSTGTQRAGALSDSDGKYHVLVRGIENGTVVDREETCSSVSRALAAATDWPEVLNVARSPELKAILSNTTEAGYEVDSSDLPGMCPPRSFPSKLLEVLKARSESGGRPISVIPCELRENNALLLKSIVIALAHAWKLPSSVVDFINACHWHDTLVDRIVTGPPESHPLLATDPMLTTCEPYALFAIQEIPGVPRLLNHPSVVWTGDVLPYFLRKVRILNGAHTALLIRAWPKGFEIVRDAVNDKELGPWLNDLLVEEIVPVLEGRCDNPSGFAKDVLDRFRNPFLQHRLVDISQHHDAKVKVRLVPSYEEYRTRFGREPARLAELLKNDGALPPRN
jgi:tagaturonate reductase